MKPASSDVRRILRKCGASRCPTIAPLILINFVGRLIGTFQSMGNIFLLTFGGPAKKLCDANGDLAGSL
jgi:hypothetical protein